VEALISGNVMLCLPASVPETIASVKIAIAEKRLSWDEINAKVIKVLLSKYNLGLNQEQVIDTKNLLEDLNAKTDAIRKEVAENSLTILSQSGLTASRTDYAQVPLTSNEKKIAYIGIGMAELNEFGKRLKKDLDAETFTLTYKDGQEKADEILKEVKKDGKYDAIIIGIHNYSLRPADNFGLSPVALKLYKELNFIKTITLTFGNVLATKNFCDAWTLVACYQDDAITQQAAADLLEGKTMAHGKLPVSVCHFKFGDGIVHEVIKPSRGMIKAKLQLIDSIAMDGIAKKAYPGCVVLAAYKGDIIYHKAFGNYEYGSSPAMSPESIFDLASVTKISATTVSVMKL